MKLEHYTATLEVKQIGDDGTFRGLAAVYGNVDYHGDVIEHGAFDWTVKNRPEITILKDHDPKVVIGTGRLSLSDEGLVIDGHLNLDVQAGRETHSNMKFGAIKGLSIGFNKRDFKMDGAIRRLLDLDVPEVSTTAFPANHLARVTEVKSIDIEADKSVFVLDGDDIKHLDGEQDQSADDGHFVLVVLEEKAAPRVDSLGDVDEHAAHRAARSRVARTKDAGMTVVVAREAGTHDDSPAYEAVAQYQYEGKGSGTAERKEGVNELQALLNEAVQDAFGDEDTFVWVEALLIPSSQVIYSVHANGKGRDLYRAPFSASGSTVTVNIAEAVQVRQRTIYEPVSEEERMSALPEDLRSALSGLVSAAAAIKDDVSLDDNDRELVDGAATALQKLSKSVDPNDDSPPATALDSEDVKDVGAAVQEMKSWAAARNGGNPDESDD